MPDEQQGDGCVLLSDSGGSGAWRTFKLKPQAEILIGMPLIH